MIWLIPVIITATMISFLLGMWLLQRRYPQDNQALVDRIDALLPQTQCAQCNYPGCRPYAEAIVEGAALDLCPPGGASVHEALVALMGESQAGTAPAAPTPLLAVIDESQCIGCTLCLPPCPVDAIVGANNQMHTVINKECTGCELCVPACPVDCITMIEKPQQAAHRFPARRLPQASTSSPHSCINCGLCDPACPVDLPAEELLHSVARNDFELAHQQGLDQCIECALCDRACPSNIQMAQLFHSAKLEWRRSQADIQARQRFKDRYAAHTARIEVATQDAAAKRAARLKQTGRWS